MKLLIKQLAFNAAVWIMRCCLLFCSSSSHGNMEKHLWQMGPISQLFSRLTLPCVTHMLQRTNNSLTSKITWQGNTKIQKRDKKQTQHCISACHIHVGAVCISSSLCRLKSENKRVGQRGNIRESVTGEVCGESVLTGNEFSIYKLNARTLYNERIQL